MMQGVRRHASGKKSQQAVVQHGLIWHLLRHQLLCMLPLLL